MGDGRGVFVPSDFVSLVAFGSDSLLECCDLKVFVFGLLGPSAGHSNEEVGEDVAPCERFGSTDVLLPLFEQFGIFQVTFELDIAQEFTNFIVLLTNKDRPERFDYRFIEELEPLVSLGLIEEVEVQLPQFCDVRAHEFAHAGYKLLAPEDAVGACEH